MPRDFALSEKVPSEKDEPLSPLLLSPVVWTSAT